ncbi:DNA invertase [Bacillus mycoides]|nr:DNA invertase [Bacillus mycoides]
MKQYKPKEFVEIINVSVRTLQRLDNEDVLIAYRNPKGRRYYTDKHYKGYMGI